ncbi:MAG: MBL fold metallo-hydrolase [Thermoplasmatales archaeon]|jgi:glyoxylase-like metal-dependent hydrolase (beta-lactamase superfamily II)|nr:MBL fold metallo-hydrolase [Thermoplasmatales archaeon]
MTKICENWFLLDGVMQYFMGETNPVNPIIAVNNDGIILIDTGPPGSYAQMKTGLNDLGFSVGDIKKIIVTHYHSDHVGNLDKFLTDNGKVEVYMGREDIPYYEGIKLPEYFPPDLEEIKRLFQKIRLEDLNEVSAENPPEPERVDAKILKQLSEQQTHFTEAGGFNIIHTPGHTPGHLSIYIPRVKVLIPGDLMMYWKGNFCGPIKSFSSNFENAVKSVKTISELQVRKVVGYHGSPYSGDVNAMIENYLRDIGR